MIRAKNYETVSKFVKVMTKILWPLFFPDTVYRFLAAWHVYYSDGLRNGLCNVPSQFARTMELIMAGQTYEICLIYLDDILVFSRTFSGTAGTFQLVVGDLFKIHKSTVCQTVHKVTQSKIHYISNARCSTKT